MHVRRFVLAGCICLLSAGCYAYRPVDFDEVRVDSEVRVRLTARQFDELNGVLPSESRVIEGRVLEENGSSYLMLVPILAELRGARIETIHQRLDISRSGIVEIEIREMDRLRTGIAIGAGAAVLGYVAWRTLRDPALGDRDPPGGPNDFVGFRIPFGFGPAVHGGGR